MMIDFNERPVFSINVCEKTLRVKKIVFLACQKNCIVQFSKQLLSLELCALRPSFIHLNI